MNFYTPAISMLFFMVGIFGSPATKNSIVKNFREPLPLPEKKFSLPDSDLPMVDYHMFGEFLQNESGGYFVVKDEEGLKKAVGIGIYPNQDSVKDQPDFVKYVEDGALEKNHWELLNSQDLKLSFYKWATCHDDPGVKLFFTGVVLERAGHLKAAMRAYYAVFIHFNESVCWSKNGSYFWYVAKAALANIFRICRDYPALNIKLNEATIHIENSDDKDTSNDKIAINPGFWSSHEGYENNEASISRIIEKRGQGKVSIVKYDDQSFEIRVNEKPMLIKGVSYSPTKIGLGPKNDDYYKIRWMFSDENGNGKIDAAFDAYVDQNQNGMFDNGEVNTGDFQLLKDMGCNAIRMFHVPSGPGQYAPHHLNKPLLRTMTQEYGIYVIMGDFLGAYTVGTSASWDEGVDYTNPVHLSEMKSIIHDMVMDLKDEPFILMWLLGNENNMPLSHKGVNSTRTNASLQPVAYAKFLNDIAAMIHSIDPDHPVAIGNLGIGFMDIYSQYADNIDIFGINAYQGKDGFGLLWKDVKRSWNKPVLITEFGCDAYDVKQGVDERSQSEYLLGCVRDIMLNTRGYGEGNALGGIVFEYLDEWWKDTHSGDSEFNQQTQSQNAMPFFDGEGHEEWFGIMGQGTGTDSPFCRQPRLAYKVIKEYWRDN